jgi:hypothetical protein
MNPSRRAAAVVCVGAGSVTETLRDLLTVKARKQTFRQVVAGIRPCERGIARPVHSRGGRPKKKARERVIRVRRIRS